MLHLALLPRSTLLFLSCLSPPVLLAPFYFFILGSPQPLTLPELGAALFLPLGVLSTQLKMDAECFMPETLQDVSGEEQLFDLALSYSQLQRVTDFK